MDIEESLVLHICNKTNGCVGFTVVKDKTKEETIEAIKSSNEGNMTFTYELYDGDKRIVQAMKLRLNQLNSYDYLEQFEDCAANISSEINYMESTLRNYKMHIEKLFKEAKEVSK